MEHIRFPDTIDELLDIWDSARLRLTLLNRTGENAYYVITKGTKVQPNSYYDSALLLGLCANKTKSYALFDVRFEKRITPEGYYLVANHKGIRYQKHVLPFLFKTSELPDFPIEKNLEKRIYETAKQIDEQTLSMLEQAGSQNILKAFAAYFFGKDARHAKLKTSIAQLAISIELKLLAGTSSPSTLITPKQYCDKDKFSSTFFASNKLSALRITAKVIMGMYLLAIAPPQYLKSRVLKDFKRQYTFKTERNKHLQLGELVIGHPSSATGADKMLELTKHGANLSAYATFAGAAYLAYSTMPQWIGYTMAVCAGLSGFRMLASLIMSKGHDSSGIISNTLDKIFAYDDSD